MSGTITFAGVGSGMDIEGIITGLTNVEKSSLSTQKSKAASYHAAVSTMSDIGSLLSKLKFAVADLDTAQEVGSNSAASSSTGIVASANGSAQPGAYSVTVSQLAHEQRTYSTAQTSASDALGIGGDLDLAVGTGTSTPLHITSSDSLNSIADKINGSGLRVSASILFDGSKYRLQIRGLDTGAANDLKFGTAGGIGDQLGLLTASNTKQAAQDAKLKVDGFDVTSSTNQVSGAIQGVTLALTDETSSGMVTIASDPQALGDKLQKVVDAYNGVITKIHTVAGHGQQTASNPTLAGDSALRSITNRLSSSLFAQGGSGKITSLAAIGVKLANDGTLSLDRTKLSDALSTDPSAVSKVLAGSGGASTGVMGGIRDLVAALTDPKHGPLQTRKDSLDSRAASMDKHLAQASDRIDVYAEQLRKQFTAMDSAVASYQAQLSQLTK